MLAAAMALSVNPPVSYSVTDLRVDINLASQRLFLNDKGTVAGKGIRLPAQNTSKGAVFIARNGKCRFLPDDITDVGGLNNHNEAVLTSKNGLEIWRGGRFEHLPAKPSDGGMIWYWGMPVGIDDSGNVITVAFATEGVYAVHRWPEPKTTAELTNDAIEMASIPFAPAAMAPDGSLCGSKTFGLSYKPPAGPFAFIRTARGTKAIGDVNDHLVPTCISGPHWVGGEGRLGRAGYPNKPFVWNDGKLTWLPMNGGEDDNAGVRGVDSKGTAVGSLNSVLSIPNGFENRMRAVAWFEGRLEDLNDFIPKDCPLVLESAEAINERGQILARAVPKSEGRWPPTLVLLTPRRN